MRNRTICHEPSTFKRIFVFCLRVELLYTSVERIHFSPLWVDGSRWNAGHSLLGLRARFMILQRQVGKGGAVSEPYHYHFC
jgi:hypothetical protein